MLIEWGKDGKQKKVLLRGEIYPVIRKPPNLVFISHLIINRFVELNDVGKIFNKRMAYVTMLTKKINKDYNNN